MRSVAPKTELILRKSKTMPLSSKEVEENNLWYLIDDKTSRINKLGSFVLQYGPRMSSSSRLSAMKVFQIGGLINWLLQCRYSDPVVFEDGSTEKHGQSYVLAKLIQLDDLIATTRLSSQEQVRLLGLIENVKAKYTNVKNLTKNDHNEIITIISRLDSAITQEITSRDFAELTPVSGVLDYRKDPQEILESLVGCDVNAIPNLVMNDLQEAFSCLRFGSPTASVMVGLRAVEGYIREIYRKHTGQPTKKVWGELIKEIHEILNEKGLPNTQVIGYLDYIRNVRNTADHPDRIFIQSEAEQVFIQATNAVRELYRFCN
jgi:hypothetical protein